MIRGVAGPYSFRRSTTLRRSAGLSSVCGATSFPWNVTPSSEARRLRSRSVAPGSKAHRLLSISASRSLSVVTIGVDGGHPDLRHARPSVTRDRAPILRRVSRAVDEDRARCVAGPCPGSARHGIALRARQRLSPTSAAATAAAPGAARDDARASASATSAGGTLHHRGDLALYRHLVGRGRRTSGQDGAGRTGEKQAHSVRGSSKLHDLGFLRARISTAARDGATNGGRLASPSDEPADLLHTRTWSPGRRVNGPLAVRCVITTTTVGARRRYRLVEERLPSAGQRESSAAPSWEPVRSSQVRDGTSVACPPRVA